MSYIGIDTSLSNTAIFVLGEDGSPIKFKNIFTKLCKLGKTKYKDFERLESIRNSVEGFIGDIGNKSVFVFYEDYSFNSVNRSYAIGELGGVLKTCLYSIGCDITLVPPLVLKKFATGNGKASKELMIETAKYECSDIKNLSKKELSSDICDAYFLAKMAWYTYAQKEVLRNEVYKERLRERLSIAGRYR